MALTLDAESSALAGEEKRISAILEITMKYAGGDLAARGDLNGSGDLLDALMSGVNMLGEELAAAQTLANERLAELEYTNKTKSEFVSIVSHEFRTPLTGIQGFSEMIADEELSPDTMREYARDINKDAKRLARLIHDMLDLDRMESGRTVLEIERIDINAVVADVVRTFAASGTAPRITVQVDPSQPIVSADRDKVVQVLTNVLSNAVKYSPGGGGIDVSTERTTSAAEVKVRDHGIGIPSAQLDSVFDRYSRVNSVETRRIQGTGLGLPIVRQLVELHGGRAWLESALGRGSTFHFTLPLAPPANLPVSTIVG